MCNWVNKGSYWSTPSMAIARVKDLYDSPWPFPLIGRFPSLIQHLGASVGFPRLGPSRENCRAVTSRRLYEDAFFLLPYLLLFSCFCLLHSRLCTTTDYGSFEVLSLPWVSSDTCLLKYFYHFPTSKRGPPFTPICLCS